MQVCRSLPAKSKMLSEANIIRRKDMVIELLRFLKGGRAHKAILYSAGLVLVAAAILTAAGCYETDFEVIDASSAVAVSNAPGTYTFPSGATRTISVVPDSNGYRLREVSKDNKVSTGYIRIVPLQGDIYIVQVKYDDTDVYYLAFIKFDAIGKQFWQMYPDVSDEKLDQLAQQHGVTLDLDFIHLEGSRNDIMAFLRAHANLPFTYGE
jgi:hypothetical protein